MAYPVTLNGRTYTLADFEGTNYVEGLPDAFEDFVTHAGDIYNSTSTTSNSIGTGSKTFTVESAKPYQAGTPLRIADAAAPSTNFMDCIVTSYSGTTLVVDSVGYAGSGTKTSWNVNIGGAASVAGTVAIAQGGTGATTAAAARTNLDVYSKADADSRFLNVSGEASDVSITGDLTVDTDTFVVDGTNNRVGIGTSSPEGGLHLNGSFAGRGLVIDLATEGVTDNVGILNAKHSAGILAFQTNSTEHARINSSGNFLVGTTDDGPSTAGIKLFNGNYARFVRATASGPAVFINGLTDNGELLRFQKDGTTVGSIGIQASGFYIDGESGHEGIRFANGAITPRENGSDSDGTSDLGVSNNRFKDLYLSGTAYVSGSGVVGRFGNTTANNYVEVIRTTTNPAYINIGATSAAASIQGGPVMKFQISDADGTNASEVARFDSSGNLAIGGTPAASDARLTLMANNPAMFFHDTTGGESDAAIQVTNGIMKFLNGANANNVSGLTQRMTIENGGDVGINVTDPVVKLHVKDPDSVVAGLQSDATYAWLAFDASGTSGSVLDANVGIGANGNDLKFRSGGATRLTLNSTGNLVFPSGNGIDFSATGNGSGTTTSEIFSDYEEGTWGPIITFGGNTTGITYTQNDGWYTRVGRLVTVGWEIVLSNKGSATGNLDVRNFPFNIAPTQRQSCSTFYFQFMSSSFPIGHKTFYGVPNSSIGGGVQYFTGSSGTSASLNDTHFTNSSYWYGEYTFYTS